MVNLPFIKLHGLGNDFILVDDRDQKFERIAETLQKHAQSLCKRSFGVGADGILLLQSAEKSALNHAKMRIFNADGSEPEMCGNGIRCAAIYLYENQNAEGSTCALFQIETLAGLMRCDIKKDSDSTEVIVDMGKATPLFNNSFPLSLNQKHDKLDGYAINMGNPHWIHFINDLHVDLKTMALELGPEIEHHPNFKTRTNVEFARVDDKGEIELWVWERGSGLTLACGTGACATYVAAIEAGLIAKESDARIHLPGGTLTVSGTKDYSTIKMQGPAKEVFRGNLSL